MKETFARIYEQNLWNGTETRAGPGSTVAFTTDLRDWLPRLFHQRSIQTVLDAGCSDRNWYRAMELESSYEFPMYFGIDIYPNVVAKNISDTRHWFAAADFVQDPLPRVDLILCREVLQHLHPTAVHEAIENFERSGSTWLLATSFPTGQDGEIEAGDYFPYDLEWQFGMPEPEEYFTEPNPYRPERLCLWRLN